MNISEEQIKNLARLSRLEISGSELVDFRTEFEALAELCGGISDAAQQQCADLTARAADIGALRADEAGQSLPAEKLLGGAHSENGFFTVKRVVN